MTFDSLNPPYGVILADPPWKFQTYSAKGRDRCPDTRHYKVMTKADMMALPILDLAARDCVLLLWVTDPMLSAGMEMLKAWGFTYKTIGFYWTKRNRDGSPFMGNGYWTRANPEQCLLATRGKPKRLNADVRRWIDSPRREHSRKPDEQYKRIERLVGGPYVELFSRTKRVGWDSWGDQADQFSEAAE